MRKSRICLPNAIYHIYNQGVNREDIYRDKEDNEFWMELLREATTKYNMHTYCFVTMKNHFHCLVETVEPNISQVLWHLGYYFARHINKKYGRVGHLFRNRCKSQLIVDLKYFQTVVWYIHFNPVAQGYVKTEKEQNPLILTSYHDITGTTRIYPWLSKNRLFIKLNLINPGKCQLTSISKKIEKFDFKELTKIEIANQKLAGLI